MPTECKNDWKTAAGTNKYIQDGSPKRLYVFSFQTMYFYLPTIYLLINNERRREWASLIVIEFFDTLRQPREIRKISNGESD